MYPAQANGARGRSRSSRHVVSVLSRRQSGHPQ